MAPGSGGTNLPWTDHEGNQAMATEEGQQELAQQLLAQAKEHGIDLVGLDGLLNRLTTAFWKPL